MDIVFGAAKPVDIFYFMDFYGAPQPVASAWEASFATVDNVSRRGLGKVLRLRLPEVRGTAVGVCLAEREPANTIPTATLAHYSDVDCSGLVEYAEQIVGVCLSNGGHSSFWRWLHHTSKDGPHDVALRQHHLARGPMVSDCSLTACTARPAPSPARPVSGTHRVLACCLAGKDSPGS